MKSCLCCHAKVDDDAPTCPRCGEASFAARVSPEGENGAEAQDLNTALANWLLENDGQGPCADGAYPARHGRCVAPLDLTEDEG